MSTPTYHLGQHGIPPKPKRGFWARIGRIGMGFWSALTISRRILANLLFLIVIIGVLVILFSMAEDEVPDGAALLLSIEGRIVEQTSEPMLGNPLFWQEETHEILLRDIVDGIDYAATDDRIRLLVLDLDKMLPAGLTKLQEIGMALNRFKRQGKNIIAIADFYNQPQYYLASYADRVYLHPMGQVWLRGYGLYRTYFKNALEKLKVQFHIFRVGTYKSALEPFMRDSMSDAAKEANRAWLKILWETYTDDVTTNRGLEPDQIDTYLSQIVDRLKEVNGDTGRLALNFGLVDALMTRDEIRKELIQRVGKDDTEMTFKHIGFLDYLNIILPDLRPYSPSKDKVGVIVAKGIIMDGKQPPGRIGGDSLSALIRKAREKDKVKALVLRVDSGGGSALASEIIRREVELTRQAGIPVVVSMGSMAASGGYWMAVSADEIWAAPNTITGSIGIFSAFPTLEKSLDALGIHSDGVGTTQLSDAFDASRPMNPQLSKILQQNVQRGYQRFIERVSRGRQMEPQAVEKIAQGRVWAGKTAQNLGLIDQLGGLKEAIASVAALADATDYNVVYISQPLTSRQRFVQKLRRFLGQQIRHRLNSQEADWLPVGAVFSEINPLRLLNDPYGLHAYCPVCAEVSP